ncbi:MAG: DUF72 domain-containing protein [Bacteroidia bacterium]
MERKVMIGCSGYYYPSWKHRFYPQGTPASKWLSFYSTVFNCVELNGTFYRVPKLKDLKKYAAETPGDFSFSVKANRYITHLLKLKDAKTHVDEFHALIREGLGNKLKNILYQLPPSFQYSTEHLDQVLESIPRGKESAIEFRHISWWNGEVEKILKKQGYTFVNSDYPGLKHTFIKTSETFYARMHGVPELFKSNYSDENLQRFAETIPQDCSLYCIYFNNTYYGWAYQNAKTLRKFIEGEM